MQKVDRLELTQEYLEHRSAALKAAGYDEPKWIVFSRTMLALGFTVTLHEAQETVSKYLRVSCGNDRAYKVRFSNHQPVHTHDKRTFYVGVSRHGVTTYDDAIRACVLYFGYTVQQAREAYKTGKHLVP